MTFKNKTAAISDDRGCFFGGRLYLFERVRTGRPHRPARMKNNQCRLARFCGLFRDAMTALLGCDRKTKAWQFALPAAG
jgi:hypothetical protein